MEVVVEADHRLIIIHSGKTLPGEGIRRDGICQNNPTNVRVRVRVRVPHITEGNLMTTVIDRDRGRIL